METLFKRCPVCRAYTRAPGRECMACHSTGFVEHGQIQSCEDHFILDVIIGSILSNVSGLRVLQYWSLTREVEALEFTDPKSGSHFEIVVRRIDGRSTGTGEEVADG